MFEDEKMKKIETLLAENGLKKYTYWPPYETYINSKAEYITIDVETKKVISFDKELTPLCEKVNLIANDVPIYEKVNAKQIQALLDLFGFDFYKIVKKNTKYEITFYFKRINSIKGGLRIYRIPALKIISKEVEE